MDEKQLYKAVTEILSRGNNVEIREKSDGTITKFELKSISNGQALRAIGASTLLLCAGFFIAYHFTVIE